MKIKKDISTVELIEALKLTFEIFYLPYLKKNDAQDIYDARKAILEELSRRNQEEFEKIPLTNPADPAIIKIPKKGKEMIK